MLTRLGFVFRLLFVCLGVCLAAPPFLLEARTASGLPERLTDQEFWRLSAALSEPDGAFRSDNLVSNEVWLQHVIPDLLKTADAGGAYLGVGPEQNFTYIAALRPSIAFIIDVRRGNLALHLMYKALFELSSNRAEFVSRLFSRPRPHGIVERSTAGEIFAGLARVERNRSLLDDNLRAIREQLVTRHGFALSRQDWSEIEYALDAFATFGPGINYLSTGTDEYGGGLLPTYAELMTATDAEGRAHSYLNTEESFRFVKDLETKNLIVPLVGNFAGTKTIRAVGDYLRERRTTVSAFYLSNVEMYLEREMIWPPFCRNAATLPLDSTSMFIRSAFDGQYGRGFGLNSDVGPLPPVLDRCAPRQ